MDIQDPKHMIGAFLVIVVVFAGGVFLLKGGEATPQANTNDQNHGDAMNGDITAMQDKLLEALSEKVKVTISTEKGDIKLDLYPKVAPKTVENFTKLARDGFYDGVTFHRVIQEFMIQGGDPDGTGAGGPGYSFEDEINAEFLGLPPEAIAANEARGYVYNKDLVSLPNLPGSISMANAGPNTNGSQFFIITLEPQEHLDGLHTVFGNVTEGMEVVTSIAQGDKMTKVTVE